MITLAICATALLLSCLPALFRKGNAQIEAALAEIEQPSHCAPWPYGVRRTTSLAVISRRDAA